MQRDTRKDERRDRRRKRIRARVRGSAARPRLAVYRSLNHIYAQAIDDEQGRTMAHASSRDGVEKGKDRTGGNLAAAREVGTRIAERLQAQGLSEVVFDRGGYPYHGRIKAVADAAREKGLRF